jgi:cell wall-associated NlpC family hydrolase
MKERPVQQVLESVKNIPDVAVRLEAISGRFLGRPYVVNPLIGSADVPEEFIATLGGFDCVTYVETALALAGARSANDFIRRLKGIRYEGGEVVWRRRNHYMTNWIRNNANAGYVSRMSLRAPSRSKERVLNILPGLRPQTQRFSCIPKKALRPIADRIRSGDLIFFASTRPHLDVFHCGIIVRDGDRLLLRHASRSQGGVVEQELSTFLNANRMAGVILVRPTEVP